MTDTNKTLGRPRMYKARGVNYTIYITPQEKQVLDYLGKAHSNGGKAGLSNGIRYLLQFFAEHCKGNGSIE